ncbi:MAG: phage tail assembly chaperone [Pseudomonadota bacterium]|nr:phage tail assembly chaperone [Pseudomonadota bacterium]
MGRRRRGYRPGKRLTGPTPWQEWLGIALGQLGWTPAVFWTATMRELAAAIDGRAARESGRAGKGRKLSVKQCSDLRGWMAETLKKHPDGRR